ncbi:UNVERIFIED_ORG: hypothetical protein J2W65_003538 [Pseudomonas parafulva]|uniref:hypothetical protein n=1 Tax=Pseudomonas fulva TaxID=47880 RepID=UPI00191FB9B3|nr:hypothetical protein [Pseudomonas fulva]MBN4165110.1 hypothetical protein [Pseudomonas fulva]MDP9557890.1 hypothetical protein [Pseudomonas parafulva]
MDKDEFADAIEAGEPLIKQSMEALKRYWEARDYGAPAEEVEWLRLHSESLAQVVYDYQLSTVFRLMGHKITPGH